ncbi:unnamed protein product, partial [Polarella glacialis]
VVQSLTEGQGEPMRWHMLSGSAMWGLGFVQVVMRRWRQGPLAWVHRFCGRAFLLLWFVVVGPTAAFLGLFCGTGRLRSHFAMSLASIVYLDTTLNASWYFWAGWSVGRKRLRGSDSLKLHGKAMLTGLMFTMVIIQQRPTQFVVIWLRKWLLLMVGIILPVSWTEGVASFFDHHLILSITTVFPYGFVVPLMLDGPRSRLGVWAMRLTADDEVELFGRREPFTAELFFWRARVPLFVVLRAVVTDCWTRDPLGAVVS